MEPAEGFELPTLRYQVQLWGVGGPCWWRQRQPWQPSGGTRGASVYDNAVFRPQSSASAIRAIVSLPLSSVADAYSDHE
jgi:hypothetical protein